MRIRNGETMAFSGSALKTGAGKSAMEAELLLFLTPRIVADSGPGRPAQAARP
jgi:hypothetical protein